MPKWRLFYHVVWTTRDRVMLITPEMEPFLYQRIEIKCHELGGYCFAANGMPDHVHVVTSIPPNISISKFVGELKGFTSRLLSLEFKMTFEWQRGYGIFSVSKPNLPIAIAYIGNQKEHHKTGTIIYALEHVSDDDEGSESLSSTPN